MRKGLWVMAGIGLAGVLVLMYASESALRSVSGIEEAVALQDHLRQAYGHLVEETPPLMVYKVPGSAEWPGFRWKVEATLRPGRTEASPEVARSVDRIVARALGTTVQGRPPSGALVLLHSAGAPDRTLLFDGQGRPAKGAAPSPAAGAPR